MSKNFYREAVKVKVFPCGEDLARRVKEDPHEKVWCINTSVEEWCGKKSDETFISDATAELIKKQMQTTFSRKDAPYYARLVTFGYSMWDDRAIVASAIYPVGLSEASRS